MARTYFADKGQSADIDSASEVLVKRNEDGTVSSLEFVIGVRHVTLTSADDVKKALAVAKEIPASTK